MKKLTPWYLAALAPIAVAGCSGALMGQMAVLAVAVAIFVGTLSLGRQAPSSSDAASRAAQVIDTPAPALSPLGPSGDVIPPIDNA